MTESDALAFVAVLQAAFPRFTGGEPTARLFATKLKQYDPDVAARGIDRLVETREETTWPSWAEVARWIREARPKAKELEPPMGEPVSREEIERFAKFRLRGVPRAYDTDAEVEARIAAARNALEGQA